LNCSANAENVPKDFFRWLLSIQHMLIQHKAGKGALENKIMAPAHIHRHDVLFPIYGFSARGSYNSVAHFDRLQKTGIGPSQNNERIIDGNHGRMVGQAKNESAVYQAGFINRHIGTGSHGHTAVAVSRRNWNTAQALVDLYVGFDLHAHLHNELFKGCRKWTRAAVVAALSILSPQVVITRLFDDYQIVLPLNKPN